MVSFNGLQRSTALRRGNGSIERSAASPRFPTTAPHPRPPGPELDARPASRSTALACPDEALAHMPAAGDLPSAPASPPRCCRLPFRICRRPRAPLANRVTTCGRRRHRAVASCRRLCPGGRESDQSAPRRPAGPPCFPPSRGGGRRARAKRARAVLAARRGAGRRRAGKERRGGKHGGSDEGAARPCRRGNGARCACRAPTAPPITWGERSSDVPRPTTTPAERPDTDLRPTGRAGPALRRERALPRGAGVGEPELDSAHRGSRPAAGDRPGGLPGRPPA